MSIYYIIRALWRSLYSGTAYGLHNGTDNIQITFPFQLIDLTSHTSFANLKGGKRGEGWGTRVAFSYQQDTDVAPSFLLYKEGKKVPRYKELIIHPTSRYVFKDFILFVLLSNLFNG